MTLFLAFKTAPIGYSRTKSLLILLVINLLTAHHDGAVGSLHKPGPPRAEVAGGRRAEDLLEIVEAAVPSKDGMLDGARGLASRPGGQRLPVEVVVVNLSYTQYQRKKQR